MKKYFDWMKTSARRPRASRTIVMREDEIAQRAALLARLGYTRAHTEQRLKQNARWEHEQLGGPTYLARLSELVAQAYGATPEPAKSSTRKSAKRL